MRTKIALLLGAAAAAMALAPTAQAQADNPVCVYLDSHPGASGIEDIVTLTKMGTDLTDHEVAKALVEIIYTDCARHLWDMKAFAAKWGTTPEAVQPPVDTRSERA